VGRHAEAGHALDEGLVVARELGNAWWIAYGLAYRSNVHASSGALVEARQVSQEAVAIAGENRLGYPLVLARTHALWQAEVAAPGNPAHTPQIEAALREAQGLGLRGLAVYLDWVRLLHRVADPTLSDSAIARDLAAGMRAYLERAPLKGGVGAARAAGAGGAR
jgi:hypothetical protein